MNRSDFGRLWCKNCSGRMYSIFSTDQNVPPVMSTKTVRNYLIAVVQETYVHLTRFYCKCRQWCHDRSPGKLNSILECLMKQVLSSGIFACVMQYQDWYHPECIQPHHIDPTLDIMVWSIINYNSYSLFIFVKEILNSIMYTQNIIQPVLLPFLQEYTVSVG